MCMVLAVISKKMMFSLQSVSSEAGRCTQHNFTPVRLIFGISLSDISYHAIQYYSGGNSHYGIKFMDKSNIRPIPLLDVFDVKIEGKKDRAIYREKHIQYQLKVYIASDLC